MLTICQVNDKFYKQLYTKVKCFPCARTQHVRHMRPSIVSMIESVLEFRFMCAILHSRLDGHSSYVSCNISSPFQCKERFCDSVSFGIIPSSVQKFGVLFSNYFVFAKLQRGKRVDLLSRLFNLTIFSPMKENKNFSHKCTHPRHFRVSGSKISNVTKATSQILLQTPWHFRKPQINLVSLCRNSFTMQDIISVRFKRFSVILIDIIVFFELVYC